jgi:hypothetical protein
MNCLNTMGSGICVNKEVPQEVPLLTYTTVGDNNYTPTITTFAEIILVGGGGSGGGGGGKNRGGGGASGGGIVYFTYELIANTTYTIKVGDKGASSAANIAGNNGSASTFKVGTTQIASATGGNAGALGDTSSDAVWSSTATAVSGSVSTTVLSSKIYSGGFGGQSGNGLGATRGGSVLTTTDMLRNNVTSINNYSGGGGGCVNAYYAHAGNLGSGGSRGAGDSTESKSNANASSYGSGGGGKQYNFGSGYGLGAQGVCFILCYTN